MSKNINNTNSKENEDNLLNHIDVIDFSESKDTNIKLHILKSNGKTQDIALMQIGDKNLLIDSGMSNDTGEHIDEIKKILEYDKIPSDAPVPDEKKIHYIYITHYHWDHAGGLTEISNAIDMHGATIFLPENPPQEYYIVDDHLNNTYDVAKNCEMTVIIPGGTAGRYIKTTTNNVDSYIFEHLTDTSNKTSFSIGRNHELTLDFKNCSTHDYYFYKDESGNERFRTEIFTETIKKSTNSFEPKKSLIKNGIKDTNGNYYDFKITIKGEAPYYTSVTLDSNGNKKYPSITVPTNGSATIEYLGINADYNNTSLCCVMTYGKTRIGFFGDIGLEAQEHLANDEVIGHLDLMNVPHHGVNGGDYRPFFDKIAPKICFTQDGKGFHYNNDNADWHFLSERSKTHAYLQENGIPNYATSVNGTMTFDISKSGISTTANAVQYPTKIKGATSIVGAINNSVPSYGFKAEGNDKLSVLTLLKNMEHGTMLSTKITQQSHFEKMWSSLLEGMAENGIVDSQLIVYKHDSSLYNRTKTDNTKSQEVTDLIDKSPDFPDSGYMVLIPHAQNPLSGPVFSHWKASSDYSTVECILKPLTRMEQFEFSKENTETSLNHGIFNTDVLTESNFVLKPKYPCLVNYTMRLENMNTAQNQAVTFYDGEYNKTITIPINDNTYSNQVTYSNLVNLDVTRSENGEIVSSGKISVPNKENLNIYLTGYVSYSIPNSKIFTETTAGVLVELPTYNTFPRF